MQHLELITQICRENNFSAFILGDRDPHNSEYIAEHYAFRSYVSGFHAEVGDLVVLEDGTSALFVDSRYDIQAHKALKGTRTEIVIADQSGSSEMVSWINEHCRNGAVGFDGSLFSYDEIAVMQKNLGPSISLTDYHMDISALWEERPALVGKPFFILEDKYAGKSFQDKKQDLLSAVFALGGNAYFSSALDVVGWIFNLRGSDIDYEGDPTGFVFISADKTQLFLPPQKLAAQASSELEKSGVEILPYDGVDKALSALPKDSIVVATKRTLSYRHGQALSSHCTLVLPDCDIVDLIKARKSAEELSHIRQAMERDGRSLVRFYAWIDSLTPDELGKETENSLAAKLRNLRDEGGDGLFLKESFGPIVAFRENAALPHYNLPEDPSQMKSIDGRGIILCDTGAHYLDGSTDITRTIVVGGKATAEEKTDYTLVLKGMIALSMARFPEGTRGYQLDTFARQFLWENGRNFGHGTGHGVGYVLGVHEGPQRISPAPIDIAIETGMVTSNEPGLYREGEYGIRIENLVAAVPDTETEFGRFLKFETLTLCPISMDLVDRSLLTPKEIDWINAYHQRVRAVLSKGLTGRALEYLNKTTEVL